MEKHQPKIANEPQIFGEAYRAFSSQWYEYIFLRNALNSVPAAEIIKKGVNPLSPISILGLNIKQNVKENDLADYLKSVKRGATLECLTFLAFFLQTEMFLKDCDSKCFWDLPRHIPRPNGFFGNIAFDDFIHFNKVIVSELRATRHCILHNRGIKDEAYASSQKKYFSDYAEIYRKIDQNLAAGDGGKKGLKFLDKVLARMGIPIGKTLPIQFDYIYHGQLALLDRIGIKSNYYSVAWSLKEGAVESVFQPGSSYDFKPFY